MPTAPSCRPPCGGQVHRVQSAAECSRQKAGTRPRSGKKPPAFAESGNYMYFWGVFGEMQEWLNWPAWKASKHQKVFQGVRIPFSPPRKTVEDKTTDLQSVVFRFLRTARPKRISSAIRKKYQRAVWLIAYDSQWQPRKGIALRIPLSAKQSKSRTSRFGSMRATLRTR